MRPWTAVLLLVCPAVIAEPVFAQGAARVQVGGLGTVQAEEASEWERSTEIDHARGTITTRLSKPGRRLATGRTVVLQLTCYPHHQLEVSVASPEYLTDYQQRNVKTDIRVRADERTPLEFEASLMGNYVVYVNHEASRRFVTELGAADSLVVSISRGAFEPYVVGFATGDEPERTVVSEFCTG